MPSGKAGDEKEPSEFGLKLELLRSPDFSHELFRHYRIAGKRKSEWTEWHRYQGNAALALKCGISESAFSRRCYRYLRRPHELASDNDYLTLHGTYHLSKFNLPLDVLLTHSIAEVARLTCRSSGWANMSALPCRCQGPGGSGLSGS